MPFIGVPTGPRGQIFDTDQGTFRPTPTPPAPAPEPKPQPKPQPSGGGTYSTPIPGAALYGQAALAAKTAYQKALARLNSKRQSTLQQYGYSAKIDPKTGVLTDLGVDPNNPYGYYQQLLHSGAQDAAQAEGAALDRGLSTSGGLGAQALTAAKHEFGKNSAQLGTELTGTLQDFQDAQDEATYQRDQALYQAELEAARMAIENQDFNPGDYTGIGGDDSGSKSDGGSSSAPPPNSPDSPASLFRLLNPTGGSGGGGSVQWGGKTFTRKAALAKWLAQHGANYNTWARRHPSAAAKLK